MSANPQQSIQKDYKELLTNGEDEALPRLAKAVMAQRVKDQLPDTKKKPKIIWSEKLQQPIPIWDLTTTNYAIVEITFETSSKTKFTVTSKVCDSGSEIDGQKNSAKSPEEHAERKALADAINQAIDAGWIPKNGIKPRKLEPPYTAKKLQEYKEILKETSIILFTERQPCNDELEGFTAPQGVETCSEALQKTLTINSQDAHKIYHCVNWKDNAKFNDHVKPARTQYYEDNPQIQMAWIQEKKDNSKYKNDIEKAMQYGKDRLLKVKEAQQKEAEKAKETQQKNESNNQSKQQQKRTETNTGGNIAPNPQTKKRKIEKK